MNIWILIVIIVVLLYIIFKQYNILVNLQMKVKQAKSGIDVYLQQRFDLIPNIIESVKNYMKYEQKLIESLTELRTAYNKTKDIKIGEELNNKLNTLIATAENYPDLKASELFLNLQENLVKMESQLQAARRIYNIDVTNYNIKINVVPYNIVAKMFRFKEESLFEIENYEARKNIKAEI